MMDNVSPLHTRVLRLFLFLALLLCLVPSVYAQTETPPQMDFSLNRDWGYGGLNGQIQGHFSARVRGPDNLQRVVFYLDDQVLGEVTAPPFKIRFVTDDYPLGEHVLYAVGYTADGQVLTSNRVQRVFVSPEEGWQVAGRIIIPALGLSVGVILLVALVSFLGERRRGPGAPRSYGLFGGAVCPRCGRPFARHWWAPNMVTAKYDRCPHCGKWSIVRAASPQALREAEEAMLHPHTPQTASPEESLEKALDESRYLDE